MVYFIRHNLFIAQVLCGKPHNGFYIALPFLLLERKSDLSFVSDINFCASRRGSEPKLVARVCLGCRNQTQ